MQTVSVQREKFHELDVFHAEVLEQVREDTLRINITTGNKGSRTGIILTASDSMVFQLADMAGQSLGRVFSNSGLIATLS